MAALVNSESRQAIQQFLGDNFTSLESLELVDDLLKEEERTHAQLEQEAAAASKTTQSLVAEASGVADSVHSKAMRLINVHSKVVGSTADESVSAWEFRDGTAVMELVSKLAAELQTYRRLRQAKEYIDEFIEIEKIAEQAAQNMAKSSQGVLSAYSASIALLSKHSNDSEVTGNIFAQNLLEYIKHTVSSIWADAETTAANAQSECLRKMGWPGKIDPPVAVLGEFGANFSMLASLDHITRDANEILLQSGVQLQSEDAPPLPLKHIARAVDIRMRYHFESARGTSRADKPEWWLSQVMNMVRSLVPLLELHLQSLYDRSALPPLDVRNEFIRLIQPIIQHKLAHDRSDYISNGLVIAHVSRELSEFEHTLQDVYFFDGPSVLDAFLADSDIFSAWVNAERKSAIDSYMETIADPGAFKQLYEDEVLDRDDPKPTLIAQNVVMLISDIAERYAVVPSCMQQLQFLSTTQFPVVIALVEDVEGEIDEFSRISLAFIRDASSTVSGSGANSPFAAQLRRLASWYQTVWYVEEAARDWNDSAIYVDMWAAVSRHARALGGDADPRDWRDECDDWSEKDRNVLDDCVTLETNEVWLDGGIWERTIKTLGELKQRILELMSRAINKDTVGQLRAYRKKANWASEGVGANADVEVSIELSGLLPELSHLVSMLSELLPFSGSAYLLRSLAAELDTFLVERVASAHQFNSSGGWQFAMDVSAISRVLRASAGSSALRGPSGQLLVKAVECARILSCSLDGEELPGDNDMALSLSEWAPAVLDAATDDKEAMLVLGKLGIRHLSIEQIRQLIKRRVDFAATFSSPEMF
ncbi:hypothetical protein IWW56_002427 [Coemansia sp. RSA 2131]|nr:hypothetical protein IWW56_002427 [Coemansia sp. RSA 2131]